jgi:DNA-binding ferritin-like protein (Dps family)
MHFFSAIDHGKKGTTRVFLKSCSSTKAFTFNWAKVLKDSVVGIIGDNNKSAASKTASDNKECWADNLRNRLKSNFRLPAA